jgi:predicted outer membrane lipoprotein
MSAANRKLIAALCCYAVLSGMALYLLLPARTSDEQFVLGVVLIVFAILTAKTLTHME